MSADESILRLENAMATPAGLKRQPAAARRAAHSDRRLEALIDIVKNGRGGKSET